MVCLSHDFVGFSTIFLVVQDFHLGNNNPNWRTHIFQRGRYTTNQYIRFWQSFSSSLSTPFFLFPHIFLRVFRSWGLVQGVHPRYALWKQGQGGVGPILTTHMMQNWNDEKPKKAWEFGQSYPVKLPKKWYHITYIVLPKVYEIGGVQPFHFTKPEISTTANIWRSSFPPQEKPWSSLVQPQSKKSTGWWFQTFCFFHNMLGIILPIDELRFFKMVIAPPTSIYI